MENKVKIVLVGAGGYGDLYLTLYRRYPEYGEICSIEGIVDPFVKNAPGYDYITERQIPVFDTPEEFYAAHTADLAVISTPIPLHKSQCLTALRNGSHVLCEKPLVPVTDDLPELERAVRESGRRLGVGFQWSFSNTMTALKRDILSGVFGKPLELKSYICWKRYDSYYDGSWKGHLRDRNGSWILDSVVTNATAHYLHNIFFVLGDKMETADMPLHVRAELYRAKPIESFDTCVLSGEFESGCRFWYAATHAGDRDGITKFYYRFENGEILFNFDRKGDRVIARFPDGTEKDYGNPQSIEEMNPKFRTMIEVCRDSGTVVPCTLDTVVPHLKVCNGLFDRVDIKNFPSGRIYRQEEPAGYFVTGLTEDLDRLFRSGEMPYDTDLDWASPGESFEPDKITHFSGGRL